ncbi:MAG: hypothetical protein P1V97_38205 [Planctomycetota bacterium]|nr:hypothetical protein [Planctomycetota bacterium]
MSELGESGFHQEYDQSDLKARLKVSIYCRMCRNSFPVTIVTNPRAQVRCTCGHKGRLEEFDVFTSPERMKDFAVFYGRIIGAVKDALRDNNIPLPPSGRYVPYREGFAEDESDIRFSYVESETHNIDYPTRSKMFSHRLEAIKDDIFDYHKVLTEYIEYSYSHRLTSEDARSDCYRVCHDDIKLVPKLIRESKRLKAEGKKVRLSFSSFKHLAILLEEDEQFKEALSVSRKARKLGLKGYEDRIRRLRKLV